MRGKIAMFMLMLCMTVSMFGVNASAADDCTDKCTRIVETYSYDEAVAYIDDNDEFSYPTKEGYLFAGWYTDESCNRDSYWGQKEPGEDVYALFVPSHILDVEAQISANLLPGSGEDTSKGSIRFVTTVDSLLYSEAGFKVSYKIGDVTKNVTSSSNKVYRNLYAVGASSGDADTEYTPKGSFCNLSTYFKACTVRNVKEAYYGIPFHVTPFWRTMDGSVVYGETVIRSINDFYAEEDVYVSASGTDAEDSGSLENPFLTLNYAIDYVKNGGNVHIIDDLTVAEGSWTAHNKTFTITNDGKTGTDSLTFAGTTVNIRDSVKFTGLDLNFTDDAIVCAWGNPLEIASDVGGFENPITLCGGGNGEAITSDTSLTIRAGQYYRVVGGGYKGDVTGNTHVVLSDKVNENYDNSVHGMYKYEDGRTIFGGGYCSDDTEAAKDTTASANVTGDTYVSVESQTALFNYIFAGGRYGKVTGDTHVTFKGNAYSVAGGSWGATVTGNTYVNMEDGEVAQIWGGCQAGTMTGNTHVYVSGGTITRRIYGGCYNSKSTGTNHVTGYTMVSIGKDAVLLKNSDDGDNSIVSISRTGTVFEKERGVFIFNDYTNNSNKDETGVDSSAQYLVGITTQTHNYFVRATSGGMVYGADDGLRIVPDKGKKATVRTDELDGTPIFYTESKGFCTLPKLDSASEKQNIYVVFTDATPSDVDKSKYEAKIDGAYYDTLEEAVDAADAMSTVDNSEKAVVVTLLENAEVESTMAISASANVTIQNESGKELKINRGTGLSATYMFNVLNGATLKIQGVGENGLTVDGRTASDTTTDVSAITGSSEVLIRNVGNVYLENTTFQYVKNNSTATNINGSIVRSGKASKLSVSDCTFDWNYSQRGGVFALVDGSEAELVTSKFNNSEALYSGGSIYAYNTMLTATDCEFTNGIAGTVGGAINADPATLTLEDCTFTQNTAKTGSDDVGAGAVSITGGSVAVIRGNNVFDGNTTTVNGGAIYTDESDVTINGATFKNHNAFHGAAIYMYSGSVSLVGDNAFDDEVALFKNNEATTNGGAVFVNKGSLTVEGYEFNTNKSGKWGGAIVYANSTTISSQITNSQFKGNSAVGNGGAIYSDTNKSATNHTLTVQDTKFDGNSSSNNGGAIYLVGGMNFILKETDTENVPEAIFTSNNAKSGGAIFKSSNATGSFDVEGYAFASNTTTSTGGGAVYFNKLINNIEASFTGTTFTGNVGASGGAIYADITNTNDGEYGLNIANCTFGEKGDTSFAKANTATNGGAVYIPRGNANITGTSFLFNKANDGGAIHVDGYTVDSTSTDAATGEETTTSINYAGTLVASECTFDGNKAEGALDNTNYVGGGGAIYLDSVDGGTKATISKSTFTRNIATKAFGGAIYSGSTIKATDENGLLVEDCTFGQDGDTEFAYANTATAASAYGGAVFITVGNANIVDTSFFYNKSLNGGAIGARVANVITVEADDNPEQALFKGNTAYTTGTSGAQGGAIRLNNTADGTLIKGYKFTSNTSSLQGGALATDRNTIVKVSECEFNDNHTNGNAGAIYCTNTCVVTIEATDFVENYADATSKRGGAIVAQSGAKLTIQQPEGSTAVSTFQENHAAVGGGAIYTGKADVTISAAVFSGNYSESGTGGAIWTNNANDKVTIQENTLFEGNTAATGGAIHMTLGNVEIQGAEFNKNTATTNGGAISLGEEIEVETTVTDEETGETTTTTTTEYKSATLTTTNCNFSENKATTNGGAFHVIAESTATVTDSTFTKNVATAGNGGAIYTSSKIIAEGENGLIVEECTFGKAGDTAFADANTATGYYGGAIYITEGNAKIVDSSFLYNKAKHGGAVGTESANIVTITTDDNADKALFEGNYVTSYGGAIYMGNAVKVIIQQPEGSDKTCIFRENHSQYGGAIYVQKGILNIDKAEFNGNYTETISTKAGNGGAIHMTSSGEATITNSWFEGNTSAQHGGAINNESGDLTIQDCDFIGNVAEKYAGAIHAVGSSKTATITTIEVTDGKTHKFENNVANTNDGGAIRATKVTLNLSGYTFIGNTAKGKGHTIANHNSSTTVINVGGCIFDKAKDYENYIYNDIVESLENPNTWNAIITDDSE